MKAKVEKDTQLLLKYNVDPTQHKYFTSAVNIS